MRNNTYLFLIKVFVFFSFFMLWYFVALVMFILKGPIEIKF